MPTGQTYINDIIAQTAAVASKVVVQAILAERGDGDVLTRHRSEEEYVRPKLGGSSPTLNFTKEVKNIYHTCNLAKTEKNYLVKNLPLCIAESRL